MKNAMTVDVEDYFQVSAFNDVLDMSSWDSQVPRIERNTDKLLELFSLHNVSATFFILGWIAERYPSLVTRIADGGHEVASHGYNHQRANGLSRQDFRDDVYSSKCLLEDICGTAIEGYRAPSFSIDETNLWAYDVLAEAGYTYSSSVYPVSHDHYGMPDAPRFQYRQAGSVREIPLSTLPVFKRNVPISGGGYFRLYPYALSEWAIQRFHKRDNYPYIFYMHPWEIDPDQPRVAGLNAKSRFRHYLNLGRMEPRLEALLTGFDWGTVRDVFGPLPVVEGVAS